MIPFSVLLSVYHKETPAKLAEALNSILLHQTLLPNEVVIVKDGPLTNALDELIDIFECRYPCIKVLVLQQNVGLGEALKRGIEACTHDWIARMDSDDIAAAQRFEKQTFFLQERPYLSALGSNIEEFTHQPHDLGRIKKVPATYKEVLKFARYRNPLNHPSVMFRKSAVQAVGSYQEVPLFEDYYLWLRLLKAGYQIENMNEVLLHFRIGDNAITRRHGLAYLKKELTYFNKIHREKLIDGKQYILLVLFRTPWRLVPLKMLKWVYKVVLR